MVLLDASNAFSKIFDMGDPELVPFYSAIAGGTSTTASWKVLYDALISPGFPGERATLTATGQNFTYDVDGKPTGGELLSLNFALGETGVVDTSVNLTSDVPLSIAGLFSTGSLQEQSQSFWQALLSGDDVIRAPAQRNVAITGDFYQVVSGILNAVSLTGGNDRLSVNFQNDPAVPLPGQAITNGESPYSGLVGDAFMAQGIVFNNILFAGSLKGGDDVITLKGFAGLDATGDAYTVNPYGVVFGGDDTILNNTHGAVFPTDPVSIRLTGDAAEVFENGYVTGGDDLITGSDYAFYTDLISGDVNSLTNGFLTGGKDVLFGRGGQDRLAGDLLSADGGHITGGNDQLSGGEDSDLMAGDVLEATNTGVLVFDFHGGNDRLSGDSGNDVISGDVLSVGVMRSGDTLAGGNDVISGGAGNDTLYGDLIINGLTGATVTGGNDRLDGGKGNDLIDGQGGTDTAVFNSLAAAVIVDLQTGTASGQGNDVLVSIENLVGSSLADTLRGDGGGNRLKGGAGNDTLAGRAGDDALLGGGGADRIIGGAGADVLSGGGGADIFVYGPALGGPDTTDRIKDFVDGTDRLDLSAFHFANFATVKALAANAGGHLSLDLPGAEAVLVFGLKLGIFDAGDVIL